MTPGVFLGAVADELGVGVGMVIDCHRALRRTNEMSNTGRGRSAKDVSLEDAAKVLVAVAVRACGCSAMRAGNIARDTGNGLLNKMMMSMHAGHDFRYDYQESTGGLTVSATISGRALKTISDSCAFFDDAAAA